MSEYESNYFHSPGYSSSTLPPPPPPAGNFSSVPFPAAYGYNYGYPTLAQHVNRSVPGQAPVPRALHTSAQSTAEPIGDKTIDRNTAIAPPTTNEEKPWYCEACDLELDSQQALKSHRKSHVKCTECNFEGAPKIVKAHYEGSHGRFSVSGFKTVTVAVPGCRPQRFQICVGNRPEDIQRWIAERKKRFPRQRKETEEEPVAEASAEQPGLQVPQASGMSSLLAGYGSSGSESDVEEDEAAVEKSNLASVPPPEEEKPPATEDNDEGIATANGNQVDAEKDDRQRGRRPCRFFMRNGSCLNGASCRFLHEVSPQRVQRKQTSKKRKREGHTTSDTLLRKLLANDMEREAALTMQLLGYIVEQNFFLNGKQE